MGHILRPCQRTLLRGRRRSESRKSFLSCPPPGHSRNSFPCSPSRLPTLPDCFFQVCAYSLLLLMNSIAQFSSSYDAACVRCIFRQRVGGPPSQQRKLERIAVLVSEEACSFIQFSACAERRLPPSQEFRSR